MVTSTSVVSVPAVRKSIAELAAEFIQQQCPPAQAWELAGKQYDSESAAIVAFHQQQAKQSQEFNVDGIPCNVIRTSKGVPMPCVTEPTAILVQGGSNAQGVQFGPKLKWYATPQFTTSMSASPPALEMTAGSSKSNCQKEQTHAWHIAEVIATKTTDRLFIREVTMDKDQKETYTAKEYTDRAEWLKIVREEIELFFDEVAAIDKRARSRRR
jgi:hypothetical protein